MAHHMACKGLPGLRAVASLAGTSYVDDSSCDGAPPVSVLHVHGTADGVIRFEGDESEPGLEGRRRAGILRRGPGDGDALEQSGGLRLARTTHSPMTPSIWTNTCRAPKRRHFAWNRGAPRGSPCQAVDGLGQRSCARLRRGFRGRAGGLAAVAGVGAGGASPTQAGERVAQTLVHGLANQHYGGVGAWGVLKEPASSNGALRLRVPKCSAASRKVICGLPCAGPCAASFLMPFARAFLGDSPDCVGAFVEPHLLQLPGSADLPMEWPWEVEHA